MEEDLFDPNRLARETELSRARVEAGMHRAADRADRVSEGWVSQALEAVRQYALTHETFLAEDVCEKFTEPSYTDGRAYGQVMTQAKRNGWIRSDGYTGDKWGAPKTRWRSLLYDPSKEPKP